MAGFCKYYKDVEQVSYDNGATWYDTGEYRRGYLYEPYSTDCGYIPPQYRWVVVSGGYECSGTTKMTQEKQQVSYDSGVTWSDIVPLETRIGSTVIQYNSTDCGYIPPAQSFKWLATYSDGHTESASCNSSTEIVNGEITTNNLSSIIIGSCVTRIGNYTFNGCSSLTNISIEATTPPILGINVFYNTGIVPIYVPCESIDAYRSSSGWSGYTSRIICDNYAPPPCIRHRAFYSDGKTESFACGGQKELSAIQQTNLISCEIVGYYTAVTAFHGADSLSSVTIYSGVTKIGNEYGGVGTYDAFTDCTALTSVTIEATTPPTLGAHAFDGSNNCIIYVPPESVNAYKAAWSRLANKIRVIP